MNLLPVFEFYTTNVFETGRQPAFVMLVAFLLTFIVTRAYTRIARHTGWGSASFGGVHTHHLVFGLVLAFAAGAAQFAFLPETDSTLNLLFAAVFGGGVALVLDEFALVFHLEDVYWEKEGRKSVDAVVIGLMFGLIFMLQMTPLVDDTEPVAGISLIVVVLVNLLFVFVAAIKGKSMFAVFGVFLPILAQVGAIRLAEPDSPWARKFYRANSKKLKRAKKRYASYEKRWRPVKEHAWDIIGGKPGRYNN